MAVNDTVPELCISTVSDLADGSGDGLGRGRGGHRRRGRRGGRGADFCSLFDKPNVQQPPPPPATPAIVVQTGAIQDVNEELGLEDALVQAMATEDGPLESMLELMSSDGGESMHGDEPEALGGHVGKR